MSDYLYALGDADNIRKKMQNHLLSGDLNAARDFSTKLTSSIQELAKLTELTLDAELIYFGGDDILLRIPSGSFDEEKLSNAMRQFNENTEATISFGVGRDTEEAFLNLARAKGKGPGALVAGMSLREAG